MDQIVRAIKPITNIALESSLRKLESFSQKIIFSSYLIYNNFNFQLTWYVAASKLVNATNNKLFCKQYKPLGTINLTVSYGFPRISSLKALHDFLTEKFCWASKLIIQTVNLQHSFNMTAVDGKYGGPGLVLEYLKSNTCKK